jgi:hypothetical protein
MFYASSESPRIGAIAVRQVFEMFCKNIPR